MITFFVPGVPATAGSKRAFPFKRKDGSLGVNMADDSGAKGKVWRSVIQDAARQHFSCPLDGPLWLCVVFVMRRPQAHFCKRGLRDSAPFYHTTKPDATKMLRAVEDALTGIAWNDDSQVSETMILKRYAIDEPTGARVSIAKSHPCDHHGEPVIGIRNDGYGYAVSVAKTK